MGTATTIKKTFSRETSVQIEIHASAEKVWQLLTQAKAYPNWNSTVVSIAGDIAPNGSISLISTLDPKRTFKLKVKAFEPSRKLVWGDAMGSRTYLIEPRGTNQVIFSMAEKIGGPLFPLFAGMIPSFDQAFEQFAADLKKAAED